MARRTKENAVDWDAIERQYRLGKKSNKQLGEDFNVNHSTIGRRAKSHGWVVDKSADVDAVTNSLLIQAASGNANPNATPSALEVKAAGQAAADVVLGHRSGLSRIGRIRDRLLAEVEQVTDNLGLFEQLGELLDTSGADKDGRIQRDRQNEAYRKVISMPERIESLKKLTEVDEKVRKGEREAFGITGDEDGGKSDVDALLTKVLNSGV